LKAKQVKGYITAELKKDFDEKVEKQFGHGKHTTQVIRKLILKYVNGDIKI
jgi:5-formaminoimidazole-4-carboxamide-1-beta-D-ribofuranosyl 5'-monophosphate synthetase